MHLKKDISRHKLSWFVIRCFLKTCHHLSLDIFFKLQGHSLLNILHIYLLLSTLHWEKSQIYSHKSPCYKSQLHKDFYFKKTDKLLEITTIKKHIRLERNTKWTNKLQIPAARSRDQGLCHENKKCIVSKMNKKSSIHYKNLFLTCTTVTWTICI